MFHFIELKLRTDERVGERRRERAREGVEERMEELFKLSQLQTSRERPLQ